MQPGSILYHTITTSDVPEKKPLENNVGKRENTGNKHFLIFPQCCLPYERQIFHVLNNIQFVVRKCFEFGQGKNLVL